jgi:hypothetical protein
MRQVWWFLVMTPLLVGQGCPNPVGPETQKQKVYRVCGKVGFSDDTISSLIQAANSDFEAKLTYNYEISVVQSVCGERCGYSNPCTSDCNNCGIAIADLSYHGDGDARKEIIDDRELPASTDGELTPGESARWSELFERITSAQLQ